MTSNEKKMIDPADVQALLEAYDSTDQGHSGFENLINGLRDLLPKPDYPEDMYPEDMLGMWARHPVHGRVLVSRTKPDDDGEVTIIWNDGATDRMRNVSAYELSFPEQHPHTLTTLEDYDAAPDGPSVWTAPDLPKSSAEKSIANVAEWFPVPTDPHNPVVWTEPGGTVMVQRLEPGDLTPAEARSVALAFLAAADYAEQEQKP